MMQFVATASLYFAVQGSSVAGMVPATWWRPFCDCDEPALADFCETVLLMYAQFDAAAVRGTFVNECKVTTQGVDALVVGTAVADRPSPGGSPRNDQRRIIYVIHRAHSSQLHRCCATFRSRASKVVFFALAL